MSRSETGIVIAGGGIAGMLAAAALGHAGHRVTLVDPAPPVSVGDSAASDPRSTACLRPAQAVFAEIGLWPRLEPHAVPLRALAVVDCIGEPPAERGRRVFGAGAEGDGLPLAWNFMNWLLWRELLAHVEAMHDVTLRLGTGLDGLTARQSGASVTLTDGSRIDCRLVVGADGRDSVVREAAGIAVDTIRYGQKSLAFAATHDVPHDEVSTEIYHEGGPFTLVPLADIDGGPASAVVWMNRGPRALELAAMDEAALGAEMTRRSAGLFGAMRPASRRGLFPIITRRARALTASRVALVAEAAHVLPPIGAQGLNTSINDIRALVMAMEGHRDDPGAPAALTAYARARAGDIAARALAIDAFNRVTRSGLGGLQAIRLAGLAALHDIAPLRRGVMRAGMAPRALWGQGGI